MKKEEISEELTLAAIRSISNVILTLVGDMEECGSSVQSQSAGINRRRSCAILSSALLLPLCLLVKQFEKNGFIIKTFLLIVQYFFEFVFSIFISY